MPPRHEFTRADILAASLRIHADENRKEVLAARSEMRERMDSDWVQEALDNADE